jgi:hypothetical protein
MQHCTAGCNQASLKPLSLPLLTQHLSHLTIGSPAPTWLCLGDVLCVLTEG